MRVKLSRATILDFGTARARSDGVRIYLGGESGAGKSSTVALITEQVIEGGGQVVVLDSHQEFGNLVSVNPDSVESIGYGDGLVSEEALQHYIAVVESGKSLLLDLSHWLLDHATMDAFVLAFVKALFALRIKKPAFTLLVVDECARYAPQQQSSGQAENVKAFITVIMEGRKWGLHSLATTQRQSLVDSNVVAGSNIRIFLRTTDYSDWKRRVRPYVPESMGITYDVIKRFNSGEAIVLCRWLPEVRVQLMQPRSL